MVGNVYLIFIAINNLQFRASVQSGDHQSQYMHDNGALNFFRTRWKYNVQQLWQHSQMVHSNGSAGDKVLLGALVQVDRESLLVNRYEYGMWIIVAVDE